MSDNVTKITVLRNEETRVTVDNAEETTRRLNEYYSQQLSNELSATDQRVRVSEDREKKITDDLKTEYEERKIGSTQYVEQVSAAATAEFDAVATEVRKEMDLVADAANRRVITEEQETKKLEELWKKYYDAQKRMQDQADAAADLSAKKQAESIKKLSDQWASDWVKMSNEVLLGKEKIGTALVQLAGQMELQMIDKGIQMVVQKTAALLLELYSCKARGFPGATPRDSDCGTGGTSRERRGGINSRNFSASGRSGRGWIRLGNGSTSIPGQRRYSPRRDGDGNCND